MPPKIPTTVRRWCIGLLVGSAISSLPWLVSQLDVDWLWPVNLVLAPGAVVAIASAGGNIHDYNEAVLLAGNIVLYAVGTYFVLKRRQR